MALHPVAPRGRILIITAALAYPQLFADGDLKMVNGLAVPEPLENGVREAEHQNVLHRFFAQVMVNAENLSLAGVASQFGVQLVGGFQIVPERFFDHDPLPAVLAVRMKQPGAMHLLDDLPELARHRGQVKKNVPPQQFAPESAELFLQLCISGRIRDVAQAIKNVLRELPPNLVDITD